MSGSLPDPIERTLVAIGEFLAGESELLARDANERSLTHKLAEYMQRHFEDWNVDCEYNRFEDGVKRLPDPKGVLSNDVAGTTIFPDIIVHRRGKRQNCLLVEAKKTSNENVADDVKKLERLTIRDGDYGYHHGLHVILDCSECWLAELTVYVNGKIDADLTAQARSKLAL